MIYFKERPSNLKVIKVMLGILIIVSITFINFNSLNDNSIFAFAKQNYIQDNYDDSGESDLIDKATEETDDESASIDDITDNNDISDKTGKLDVSDEPVESDNTGVSNKPVESDRPSVPDESVKPNNPTQINNELPDGIFGSGDIGEDVKKIQTALNKIGYSVVADGIFGVNTKAAILDFQMKYADLPDDGIYSPALRGYLQNAQKYVPYIVSNPSDVLALVNKKNRLPTDYVPKNLVVPNVPFTFKEYSERRMMRQDAALALEKMFMKASEYNINLYGLSGYRSYSYQQSIFASNVSKYGFEGANQFSAKPGESEHQTGLAMDITSASVGYGLTQSFGETKEGKWVKDNAHKFGFIIRYQRGKEYITGYQYEPWHLRYVGTETAAEIVNRNITLEEYLASK